MSNVIYPSESIAIRAMLSIACDFDLDKLKAINYHKFLEDFFQIHDTHFTNMMKCGAIYLFNAALNPEINTQGLSKQDQQRLEYYAGYLHIDGVLQWHRDNELESIS